MIPGTGPPADEVERIVTLNKRVLLDGKRDAQFDPDGEVLLIRAVPLFPENGCGSNLVVLRWSITIAGTIALAFPNLVRCLRFRLGSSLQNMWLFEPRRNI